MLQAENKVNQNQNITTQFIEFGNKKYTSIKHISTQNIIRRLSSICEKAKTHKLFSQIVVTTKRTHKTQLTPRFNHHINIY